MHSLHLSHSCSPVVDTQRMAACYQKYRCDPIATDFFWQDIVADIASMSLLPETRCDSVRVKIELLGTTFIVRWAQRQKCLVESYGV